ncbi:MAG: hypothetical protein JOY92_13245 [Verrucomicrobia bacterium]|nr:hypothetical protein [Verrucomicrobiota bacterium]
MPALSQPDGLGLAGARVFAFGAENPNDQFGAQSWLPRQLLWGQFEPDGPLPDNVEAVDFSSLSASPEAVRLRRNLHVHGQSSGIPAVAVRKRTSILDFPRLDLGTVLRPLDPDDDLLGEMLGEAWS